MRADCSGSIETNPFSCRSAEPCTVPAKSAVAPALSPPICASVNGFCVAAGAEQSEFRLLHSSRYWPTLSLIILANIDTACVVSHLYPLPLPLPCSTEREKTEREKEGRRQTERMYKREETKKCTCIHCFVIHYDAIISEIALRCAGMLCLYSCFRACEENAVHTQGFSLTFLPCHLNSSENKCTMPTQAFNT